MASLVRSAFDETWPTPEYHSRHRPRHQHGPGSRVITTTDRTEPRTIGLTLLHAPVLEAGHTVKSFNSLVQTIDLRHNQAPPTNG